MMEHTLERLINQIKLQVLALSFKKSNRIEILINVFIAISYSYYCFKNASLPRAPGEIF